MKRYTLLRFVLVRASTEKTWRNNTEEQEPKDIASRARLPSLEALGVPQLPVSPRETSIIFFFSERDKLELFALLK